MVKSTISHATHYGAEKIYISKEKFDNLGDNLKNSNKYGTHDEYLRAKYRPSNFQSLLTAIGNYKMNRTAKTIVNNFIRERALTYISRAAQFCSSSRRSTINERDINAAASKIPFGPGRGFMSKPIQRFVFKRK